MEVMNPVDYSSLQEKLNGLSKQYFSYSTSIKDRSFSLHKQANKFLHIETDQTAKLTPTGRNQTHSLIVWGCGEFGQHGLTQNGDVTFEMAICKFKSGALMLPDGQLPVSTVCGSSHTLVLTGTDQIYSWGNGTSGQLGNGMCLTTTKPTLVPLTLDSKIQGMSCGARHSFIWTSNGYCYSFGNNFNAQLGYNFSKADFKENQLQPILVELFPDMKVKEVACGARHSLFLLNTGHVMAVGCNQHGQIGNDTTQDVVIPTMLDDLTSITHVACGNIHSLASHENGSVLAWGYGKAFGNKTRHVPTPQKFTPKDTENSAVISLAGGDCHSMVLYDNGVVFSWGNNYEGQLGVGKDIKYQHEPEAIPSDFLPRPVIQIACGEATSAAVTGNGELFMWGKNAGLIHCDKPSQYFQYIPHQIEMDGLIVTQISCGAWHVSAIIKNSENATEEISQNLESESFEAKKPALTDQKLHLVKDAGSPYEVKDNVIPEDNNEQKDNKCRNESMDEVVDSSLSTYSITKHNSQTEVSRISTCNSDEEFDDISLETCCTTKYSSNCDLSTAEDEFCENDVLLAARKQLPEHCEKSVLDQEEASCVLPKSNNSSLFATYVDETSSITDQTRKTKVMVDSLFNGYTCQERQHESRLQPDEAYSREKLSESLSTSKKFVDSYPEEKLTNTCSQKHPLLRHTSWIELQDSVVSVNDEGSKNKDNVFRNEKAASSCAIEAGNVRSIEENDNLEGEKGENIVSFPNRREDFIVSKNIMIAGNNNENFTWDKNVTENDYFLGSINDTIKMGINENKGLQFENPRLKHRYDLKSSLSARESGSDAEKDLSEDILGLSSIKQSSVLRRNIRLAVTPLQNSSIKQTSSLKRNAEIKVAVTASENNPTEQTTTFKSTSTSSQNKTIGCDSQVFNGRPQQTVPVIDLSFQRAEQSRLVKPSFKAFTNVWKASNAFREKQRQRKISTGRRRGSDVVFSLESMLPNRPTQAVREIDNWSKLKEHVTQWKSDSVQSKGDSYFMNASAHLKNDLPLERRGKTGKLSKCCHHRGELLPPIGTCKKNTIDLRRRDTLTDVVIDMR